MADEAAHLWAIAKFVRPPQEIARCGLLAAAQRSGAECGRHIQRIQKALTQMNIQLANVLSDVSGMTGQAIIKAILAGERDPHKLAELRDPRVKASEEQIEQESGGLLARRFAVCAEAGAGWLRVLPEADG